MLIFCKNRKNLSNIENENAENEGVGVSHSCKRAPPSLHPRGIFRRVIAIRQSVVVVVQSRQFIGRLKSQQSSGGASILSAQNSFIEKVLRPPPQLPDGAQSFKTETGHPFGFYSEDKIVLQSFLNTNIG